MHGGHTDRVGDFSWNEKAEWFMASVADSNDLHVWQPSSSLLEGEIEEEEEGRGDGEEAGGGGGGGGGGAGAKRQKVADDDLE